MMTQELAQAITGTLGAVVFTASAYYADNKTDNRGDFMVCVLGFAAIVAFMYGLAGVSDFINTLPSGAVR